MITQEKKRSSFPHVFVILLSIMVVAMVATWFVPAGEFNRQLDPVFDNQKVDHPDNRIVYHLSL
jgi:uncharacterized ion transporter superfamily protein YfcC